MRIVAFKGNLELKGRKIVHDNREFDLDTVSSVWVYNGIKTKLSTLDKIASNGIPIFIFNKYGLSSVIVTAKVSKGLWYGEITVLQAKAFLEYRDMIAKEMVSAIAYNIYRIFQKQLSRISGSDKKKLMKTAYKKSKEIIDKNFLLAEAIMWRALFKTFKEVYKNWNGRLRRPPRDRLNALLSFSNSLLYAESILAVLNAKLDPSISFVHSPSLRTRFSLPLDIKDIFAPAISVRLSLSLIRRLDEGFFKRVNIKGKTGIYLNSRGRDAVVKEFFSYLKRRVSGKTYSEWIFYECIKLRKFITGEMERYNAWRVD